MSRWEPDARGRLLRAAIDLFCEQGYDVTTTAQIAARAGLTKTTLFRLFPDKREILFQGQAVLIALAEEGVRTAPAGASAFEVAAAGIAAMTDVHTDEQRGYGVRLNAIIRSSPDLQERAAYKRSTITRAMAEALAARLSDRHQAGLLADLSVRAYYEAFDAWAASAGDRTLTDVARGELAATEAAFQSLLRV